MVPRPTTRREELAVVAALVVVLALVAVLVLHETAPRRALLRLPPAEREELFARTRAEAEALCARHESVFEEECTRRLDLLRLFPECDADCERFLNAHRTRPAR